MSELCNAQLAIATVPPQQADMQTLLNKSKALDKGTIFPELYLPFFITETESMPDSPSHICQLKDTDEECRLLVEIMETGFYLNDLTLYLDTHPEDTKALELYARHAQEEQTLKTTFAKEYYPLTPKCVPDAGNAAKTFAWTEGPAPWEGVCV